jgi:hypothetical protein
MAMKEEEEEEGGLGERLRLALQLAFSALVASAGGGLILVLLLLAAAAATAFFDSGSAGSAVAATPAILVMAIMLSGLAIAPAVAICWLPAFLAGAILRAAGRRHGWARGRSAWAAAGAAVAGLAWLRAFPPGAAHPPFAGFDRVLPTFAAAFLLAGAAAGQVFRSAMAAVAPFFGLDEEGDEQQAL